MNELVDSAEDYVRLTEGSGWVDVSERTVLRLSGEDRAVFLHNMCTNDIKSLPAGQGAEVFLTTVQGKILAYCFAYVRCADILLETSPGQAAAMTEHLDRYVIREDVNLNELEVSKLVVAGLAAPQILAQVTGCTAPDEPLANIEWELAGAAVTVCRYPLNTWPAYAIFAVPEAMKAFVELLHQAGCGSCQPETLETLRIEAGLPEYGRDIDAGNLPQEVCRNAEAISFVKGCYLGQETVARIDALGHVNRMLVGVELTNHEMPAGCEFLENEKAIGRLTSVAYSPRIGKSIGISSVKRGFHEPGTELQSKHGTALVRRFPLQ